jgi:hypothetical protein
LITKDKEFSLGALFYLLLAVKFLATQVAVYVLKLAILPLKTVLSAITHRIMRLVEYFAATLKILS